MVGLGKSFLLSFIPSDLLTMRSYCLYAPSGLSGLNELELWEDCGILGGFTLNLFKQWWTTTSSSVSESLQNPVRFYHDTIWTSLSFSQVFCFFPTIPITWDCNYLMYLKGWSTSLQGIQSTRLLFSCLSFCIPSNAADLLQMSRITPENIHLGFVALKFTFNCKLVKQ